jgi:hypothetical protein
LRFQDDWLRRIRSQLICDELVWDEAIFLQQLAHQFECRLLVPPGLDENVDRLFALFRAPALRTQARSLTPPENLCCPCWVDCKIR